MPARLRGNVQHRPVAENVELLSPSQYTPPRAWNYINLHCFRGTRCLIRFGSLATTPRHAMHTTRRYIATRPDRTLDSSALGRLEGDVSHVDVVARVPDGARNGSCAAPTRRGQVAREVDVGDVRDQHVRRPGERACLRAYVMCQNRTFTRYTRGGEDGTDGV